MDTTEQHHPANTVFLLLEDRSFRFEVIKPGLIKEKHRLGKLVSGKHQVKGFRHISKAPVSMIIPAISEEVNVSPELAQVLLQHWYDENGVLKGLVSAKLASLGYEPKEKPFDEDGNTHWLVMKHDHADAQYAGTFIEGENENAVMLMSLLLGWFGTDEDESDDTAQEAQTADKKPTGEDAKTPAAKKSSKTVKGDDGKKAAPKAKTVKKTTVKTGAAKGKVKTTTKKTGAASKVNAAGKGRSGSK